MRFILRQLPMLKLARDVSGGKMQVLATTWSPPVWMKTNNNITGHNGYLKEEYYQCYADYYSKCVNIVFFFYQTLTCASNARGFVSVGL